MFDFEMIGASVLLACMAVAWWRSRNACKHLEVQLEAAKVQAVEERARRVEANRKSSSALVLAKREETALRQSKERFLEVVSHELRTPLAAIAASTEILRDELRDREHSEWLDMAVDSTRRLTRTVERIEELVQLESSAESTGFEIVAIDEVVSQLQSRIVEFEDLDQVHCLVSWPNRPVGLEVHGQQLTRMVELLVENALRFSPKEDLAKLCIETVLNPESELDRLRFTIEDRGPGIPAEQRRMIFESFHQVRENLSDKPSGMGLGLTICTAIAGNVGTRIRVEANEPKGSRFVFELPCRFRSEEDRLASVGDHPRQWLHEFAASPEYSFVDHAI